MLLNLEKMVVLSALFLFPSVLVRVAGFDVWLPTHQSTKSRELLRTMFQDPHLVRATFQRRLPFSSAHRQRDHGSSSSLAYKDTDGNSEDLGLKSPLEAPQYTQLSSIAFERERNQRASSLLNECRRIGTHVGMDTTEANREFLKRLARELAPFTDDKPAKVPLTGTYDLVYSGSKSGFPAGKVGPFTGKVTQIFHNETVYENVLELGPMRACVFANRKILDDDTIEVKFYKRHVDMFGMPLNDAAFESVGAWKQLFVGVVALDRGHGEDKKDIPRRVMLRVMLTPELFILTQDLPDETPTENNI